MTAESEGSIVTRAGRGSIWVIGGFGSAQLLRLVGNLILTRLLFQEAFGLMALVTVFIQGTLMFSDVGIGPSIVRSPRGDEPAFFRTAWTLQIVRGLVLWGVGCLGALPFAAFYGEEQLAWLLPVVTFNAVLGGLNSTKLFRLERQIHLRAIVALDVATQASGIALMIGWAVWSPTVWALVAGGVASAFLKMVASHWLFPGERDGLTLERDAVREILTFGGWIFVSTSLRFFARESDRLILGKIVSMAMLGAYSIGSQLAAMPAVAIRQLTPKVVFPLYSHVLGTGRELGPVFGGVRRILLVATGALVSCLIAGGPPAVATLYDARYADAGWVVSALSIGTWFVALDSTYGAALLAHGRSEWMAASNAAKLVAIGVLMPLGYALYGVPGAVGGFAASNLAMYGVSVTAARSLRLRALTEDARLSLLVIVTAASGRALCDYLASLGAPPSACLVALAGVATAVWLPAGLRAWRQFRALKMEVG